MAIPAVINEHSFESSGSSSTLFESGASYSLGSAAAASNPAVLPKAPSPLRRMVSAQDLLPRSNNISNASSQRPSLLNVVSNNSSATSVTSIATTTSDSCSSVYSSSSAVSDSEYADDYEHELREDDSEDAGVHYYYPHRRPFDMFYVPMVTTVSCQPHEGVRKSAMRVVSESLRKLVVLGDENVEEDMRKRLVTMRLLRAAIDALSDHERESLADTLDWTDAASQFGEDYSTDDDSLRSIILSLHTITV
eukprot:m.233792 g.233792  ORF g.233792 m.233792 type:complete len:250 (-) comp19304_c0_seq1:99-848(-)